MGVRLLCYDLIGSRCLRLLLKGIKDMIVTRLAVFTRCGIQLFPVVLIMTFLGRLKRIVCTVIVWFWHSHFIHGIEQGYFRSILCIEINRGDCTELTNRIFDGCHQYLPYRLFVLEFNFRLGRMYIHIDGVGIYVYIYIIWYLFAHGYHPVERRYDRFVEIGVLEKSPVGK